MNSLETEFVFKTLTIIGSLHLLMFGVIAFFLKGIYENTHKLSLMQVESTAKSSSNTKRLDKLSLDTHEINRSLHDFKNDIGGRVTMIEFRMNERTEEGK